MDNEMICRSFFRCTRMVCNQYGYYDGTMGGKKINEHYSIFFNCKSSDALIDFGKFVRLEMGDCPYLQSVTICK